MKLKPAEYRTKTQRQQPRTSKILTQKIITKQIWLHLCLPENQQYNLLINLRFQDKVPPSILLMTNTQSAKKNFLNSKIMKPISFAEKPNLDVSLMSSLSNTMKILRKIKNTNRLGTRALTTPAMRNTTTIKTQKAIMMPKKERTIKDIMRILIRLVIKAKAVLLTIPDQRITK